MIVVLMIVVLHKLNRCGFPLSCHIERREERRERAKGTEIEVEESRCDQV